MFSIGKSTRKKIFKYKVTVKGVKISQHYTKKAAYSKAKGIRGAKVVSISKRAKKRYTKRKTYSSRRY